MISWIIITPSAACLFLKKLSLIGAYDHVHQWEESSKNIFYDYFIVGIAEIDRAVFIESLGIITFRNKSYMGIVDSLLYLRVSEGC